MFNSLPEFFNNIEKNQLLVALLGGGIIWQLLSNIRIILSYIWDFVLSCISFTITCVSALEFERQVLYYKAEVLFSKSKVLWERNISLQPATSDYDENRLANVAIGRSYRWFLGHLVILDRSISTKNLKVCVELHARVFFANKKRFLRKLTDLIEKTPLTTEDNNVLVRVSAIVKTAKPKRDINSIYTNNNEAKNLLSDVKAFLDKRDIYEKTGMPYKFVGLLTGTPGTGKTSTIHAIASEIGLGVRFISMDKEDFYDIARALTDSRKNGRPGEIIVIEDIDCMSYGVASNRDVSGTHEIFKDYKQSRNEDEENDGFSSGKRDYISLGSILNILDGIITPVGTIVFLTTNHPEMLDRALLRDGRIDAKYNFTNFTPETVKRLTKDQLNIVLQNPKGNVVPASIQHDILMVSLDRMSKDDFVKKYSLEM